MSHAAGPILKRLEADTINKELIDRIEGFIRRNHTEAPAKIFDELKPADAADVIEHLAPDERLFIFNLLTSEGAGDVLVEIEPPVQKQILADLENRFLSEILQEVDSDEAAEVDENEDVKAAIGRADRALYRAKEAGRNRVEMERRVVR